MYTIGPSTAAVLAIVIVVVTIMFNTCVYSTVNTFIPHTAQTEAEIQSTGISENIESNGSIIVDPSDAQKTCDSVRCAVAVKATTDDHLDLPAVVGVDGPGLRRVAASSEDWYKTHAEPPDCSAICGSRSAGSHRLVEYKTPSDLLINGVRPEDEGLYCVPRDATVTRCNTATSRVLLLIGPDGQSSYCVPRWPGVFGGPDGGDILVCGGSVRDGVAEKVYTNRLPPSYRIPELTADPYTETVVTRREADGTETTDFRWKCAPGRHMADRVDHMGNKYVRKRRDRFKRVHNKCAKYIYRAVVQIGSSPGRTGYCDCLAGHGKIHVHADHKPITERYQKQIKRKWKENRPVDTQSRKTPAGMVSVPHACSPCDAGGGLDNDSYVVRFARHCVKSYHRWQPGYDREEDGVDTFETVWDRFPCGARSFDERGASCSSATAYVGVGLSEFARRLVGRKTLLAS